MLIHSKAIRVTLVIRVFCLEKQRKSAKDDGHERFGPPDRAAETL